MASSVFFKFKSHKESQKVAFDGTGVSVFELKREIITLNKLGDGRDFDLLIFNADTNEEYKDDTEIIPRGSSITGARRPAAVKGRGNGARYVSGRAPVKALNTNRSAKDSDSVARLGAPIAAPAAGLDVSNLSEEDRISQMLAANADQWKQQSDQMAGARKVHSGVPQNRGGKSLVPDRPLPANYICYRCGQKGHFIQACPTNDDPNYENKVRIKRTTGIPKSFLKTVERPVTLEGGGIDVHSMPAGVMVNSEGEFVVAEPDTKAWEKFQAKQKVTAAAREADETLSKELEDMGLACPIDRKLYMKPAKTPCCGKTFCNDCISNALMENDFNCPECETAGVLLDDLKDDLEMEEKVEGFKAAKAVDPAATTTVRAESATTPSTAQVQGDGTPEITIKREESVECQSQPAAPTTKSTKNPTSSVPAITRPPSTDSTASRKRKAEDALENPRGSKAPSPLIKIEPSLDEADEEAARTQEPSHRTDGDDADAAASTALQDHVRQIAKAEEEPTASTENADAVAVPLIDPQPETSIMTADDPIPSSGVVSSAINPVSFNGFDMSGAPPTMNWMTAMGNMMGMNPTVMNPMMFGSGTGIDMGMSGVNPMMGFNGMSFNGTGVGNGAAFNPMMMGMMNPMMGTSGGLIGMGGPFNAGTGQIGGQSFGFGQQHQQHQQQQFGGQQAYAGAAFQDGRGQAWRGARGSRGRRGGNWRNEQVHH